MRTPAIVLALLVFLAVAVNGQPVTISLGPVGGAAPFGEAYSGVGVGATAELSARYHFGSWSAGAGMYGSSHGGADIGRQIRVGAVFVEARYGDELSERSLQAGDRFYPYAGLRVGYAQRERRETGSVSRERGGGGISYLVIQPVDGPVIQPAVGFQMWLSRDLAIDVGSGVRLADFDGSFGGSMLLQTGLVIGL